MGELAEQAAQARLVVLLLLEAQLAKQPVDARLERGRRGVRDLLRDVVEREPAVQQLEHDRPGLVEMVVARGEHWIAWRCPPSGRPIDVDGNVALTHESAYGILFDGARPQAVLVDGALVLAEKQQVHLTRIEQRTNRETHARMP